ncbi:MAG: large conductance mechanosensitive channel protein MscL [Clostridia bacterium]|nr:large conductance mechanosensitive channel protein MscL [Clostridia bacterium]
MAKKEKKKSTFWADFKAFISRGNVIDMAVGVAVAGAFTAIVGAFTQGFVSPILALLTNDANLSEMKIILRPEVTHLDEAGETVVDVAEVALLWGNFVQKVIDFLIIALVFFLILRIVTKIRAKAREKQNDLKENLKSSEDKAAAAAAAKAAEEAAAAEKAAAEAAAAEKAAREEEARKAEMEAWRAQVEVSENTGKLLTEIRDLLKAQQDNAKQ